MSTCTVCLPSDCGSLLPCRCILKSTCFACIRTLSCLVSGCHAVHPYTVLGVGCQKGLPRWCGVVPSPAAEGARSDQELSQEPMPRTLCVKLQHGATVQLSLPDGPAERDSLIAMIRQSQGLESEARIRLICAGSELHEGDTLPSDASVVHCVISTWGPFSTSLSEPETEQEGLESDHAPTMGSAGMQPPLPRAAPEPAVPAVIPSAAMRVVNMVDNVDPGLLLLCTLGGCLALTWVLLLTHMDGQPDIKTLIIMGVISSVFILSCLALSGIFPRRPPGTAVYGDVGASRQDAAEAHGGIVIPPRPHARLRGPLSGQGGGGQREGRSQSFGSSYAQ